MTYINLGDIQVHYENLNIPMTLQCKCLLKL